MKTFKRILATFMCITLILAAAPLKGFVGLDLPSLFDFIAEAAEEGEVYSGTCGDNLTWELDTSTGVLEISGVGAMSFSTQPWNSYRDFIKTVKINEGVSNVENTAFGYCTQLNEIVLPSTITEIERYAFRKCILLESVSIPNGTKSIRAHVFEECDNLTNVYIPASVTLIESYVFQGCSKLISVQVSKDNKHYSNDIDGVLYNKDQTTLLQYPAGSLLQHYSIKDTVTKIEHSAFYEATNLLSVDLSENVKSIGATAFKKCTNLKSIKFNDGLEQINMSSFSGCDNLTSVNIPSSVLEIQEDVFTYCANLASINVDDNNSNYFSDSVGALYDKKNNILIRFPCGNSTISYNVPNGVNRIEERAFLDCNNLKTVELPDSVTHIGTYAFANCSKLEEIVFGEGLSTINSSAFNECTSLLSIILPESIKVIKSAAFQECTNLTYVVLPNGLESLGENAFRACKNLKSIILPDSINGKLSDYLFYDCFALENVKLSKNITDIGNYCFGSCRNLSEIDIPDGVTDIGESAFYDCGKLIEIVLPDSVTTIGERAFYYCDSLSKVKLSNNITTIPKYAFYFDSNLSEIKIPSGVTSIDENAFYACNLKSVTLPDSITEIKSNAFGSNWISTVYYNGTQEKWDNIIIENGNTPLINADMVFGLAPDMCGENLSWYITDEYELVIEGTGDMDNYTYLGQTSWAEYNDRIVKITVSEGVTSIGIGAFYGCDAVTSISLPSTLRNIGLFSFGTCTVLKEINVSSDNEWYCSENGIVYDKDKTVLLRYPAGKNATSFDIPDSVQTIGKEAFSDSVYLETVSIPDSVKKIEYHAFYDSQSLEMVEIPASVEVIGNNVFDACYSLEAINVSSENATYSSVDGVLFSKNGTELIYYPATKVTAYTIPDGVKTIKENAFLFSNVDTFVIPKSVTVIEAAQCRYGSAAKNITYAGTKSEWDAIDIDPSEGLNDALINANLYCTPQYETSNCKISIKRPNVQTVSYGEVLMFEAVVNNLPEGAKIVWKLSGDASAKLKISEDGMSCTVKVTGAGELKVTASVVNEQGVPYKNANGNNIASHKTFTAKAGLWEFIIWIFRSLFGAAIVYQPETLL